MDHHDHSRLDVGPYDGPAEDIAVGVHYLLTQPRRAVVQQLTITPRKQDQE